MGLRVVPRVGDNIEIQYGEKTAQFRVMWELGGHVGAQSLHDASIWDSVGPLTTLRDCPSGKAAQGSLIVKVLAPRHYLDYLRRLNAGQEKDQENTVFLCLDPSRPKSFRALGPANHHMAPAATKKIEGFITQKLKGNPITGSAPGQDVSEREFFVNLLSQPASWQRNSAVLDEAPAEPKEGSDIVHGITRGIGQLISRSTPAQKYKVEFTFEIVTELVSRAADRWASGKATGWGEVRSLGGRELPSGDYDLETSDGEVLHVKNAQATWVILPS